MNLNTHKLKQLYLIEIIVLKISMINNTYFRLRFGLVNSINAYLRLKIDVVCEGAIPNLRLIMCFIYQKPLKTK